jgi:hypothetical protein
MTVKLLRYCNLLKEYYTGLFILNLTVLSSLYYDTFSDPSVKQFSSPQRGFPTHPPSRRSILLDISTELRRPGLELRCQQRY